LDDLAEDKLEFIPDFFPFTSEAEVLNGFEEWSGGG